MRARVAAALAMRARVAAALRVDPVGDRGPLRSTVGRTGHERLAQWGQAVHDGGIVRIDQYLAEFEADSLHVAPSWRAGELGEVELVLAHAETATRIARVQSHIVEEEITQTALPRDERRTTAGVLRNTIGRSDSSVDAAITH